MTCGDRGGTGPSAAGDLPVAADVSSFLELLAGLRAMAMVACPEGHILYANRALTTILGHSPESLATLPASALCASADRERAAAFWASVPPSPPHTTELLLEHAAGTAVAARVRSWRAPWAGSEAVFSILEAETFEDELQRLQGPLFRTNPSLMALSDAVTGRFLDVNDTWLETLGFRRDQIIGRTADELDLFADPALQHAASGHLKRDGRMSGHELRVRRSDGKVLTGLFSGEVLTVGGQLCLLTVMIDVTEQRKAQALLRASEERHKAIIQTATSGFWLLDMEGRVLEVNDTYCRMSGYSREELLAMRIPDVDVHAGWRDFQPVFQMVREAGSMRFETLHRRKDSSVYEVEVSTQYRPDEGGQFVAFVRDISEKKRLERERAASEEKHLLLFESMSQGVVYHDAEGRVLSANPAAERIMGVPLSRLVGQLAIELPYTTVRDDGSPLAPELRPSTVALRTGITVAQSVLGVNSPDRPETTWILVTATPLFHPGESTPFQVYTTIEDITERRRAEHDYRTLFTEMLEGIAYHEMIHDETGRPVDYRFLSVNPAFERVLSLTAEQVCGKTARQLLPTLENFWVETYGRVTATGRPEVFEHYAASLGKHFEVTAFRTAPGQFACIFSDISERRRMESLLKARLRLIEYSSTHSLDEVLVATLDELESLTGSLIGFYHFVEPDQQTLRLQAWSTRTAQVFCHAEGAGSHYALDKAGVWADCIRLRRPVIHNDYSILPHRKGMPEGHAEVRRELVVPILRDGGVVAALGVGNKDTDYTARDVEIVGRFADLAWDIAQRKHAEQEHQRVTAQLAMAQKMESIGRLAGGVAHDFNNLLTVINGYGQWALSMLHEGDPLKVQLQEICQAGDRAAGLTRQLLAFSRKQVIQPRPIDLNQSVSEIERMLGRLIGEDVELVIQLQPDLHRVLADPDQMSQVIMNLAVNARDAMPAGGRLEIQTQNVELSEDEASTMVDAVARPAVRITVRDSGAGMDTEILAHIFEPFFTTKEQGKGTGLGLSMVYGIVRQSGGWLHVESAPGEGSAFHVYLPILAEEVEQASAETRGLERNKAQGTILVVEDQEAVRRFTVSLLRRRGFHVLEAEDGIQAYVQAREFNGRIDLLLTDVILPGLNGRELSERLKGPRPEMRVLFVSGYTADVIARSGALEPGVSYLPKPFSPDALEAKVAEVLSAQV